MSEGQLLPITNKGKKKNIKKDKKEVTTLAL